jgi:hypothetical protein
MKKMIIAFFGMIFLLPAIVVFGQGAEANLKEARAAYGSGDLEAARFALQQAINEVDLVIGKEILKLLPAMLGELTYTETDDVLGAGNLGFAGLHLSRSYGKGQTQNVELSIIADSPLLAGINAILALPAFAADPNQKRVRIGGYRGLLQKSDSGAGEANWDLQIPFGSSLLSMSFRGISDEKTVTDMAGTIPVDQIARMIQ